MAAAELLDGGTADVGAGVTVRRLDEAEVGTLLSDGEREWLTPHSAPVPPRLTVELVPQTCWFSNVRSEVTSADWNRIRRYVYERAGHSCEICGGSAPSPSHGRPQGQPSARRSAVTGSMSLGRKRTRLVRISTATRA